MRARPIVSLRGGLTWALAVFLPGCEGCSIPSSALPPESSLPWKCGLFDVKSKVDQAQGDPTPGLLFKVDFQFQPQACAITRSCSCTKIAFVQLLRFTDQSDTNAGEVFQWNDEVEWRMLRDPSNPVVHGWSIDREEGREWPFYGMNNDGTWDAISDPYNLGDWTIFEGQTTPGSNTKTTVMIDKIANPHKRPFRVDVVQVPICLDEHASCRNRALGYNGFAFAVAPDPATGQKITGPTLNVQFPELPAIFNAALNNWNQQDDKNDVAINAFP